MILSKPKSDDGLIAPWNPPSFLETESVDVGIGQLKMPTAGELEKIRQHVEKEAAEKGYLEGLDKGLKAGAKEVAEKEEKLDFLLQSMLSPLSDLDEQVENELVMLAIQIAKQLIRRELKVDSGQVVAVVKEAIAVLPSSSQNIQLRLHPDDAQLVKSALSLDQAGSERWQVVEDPIISRGGCRVITDSSRIDATIENRLSAIVAKAFGDQRGNE